MAESPGIGNPSIDPGMNKQPPGEGEPPANAKQNNDDIEKSERAARQKKKKDDQALLRLALKRFKRASEHEADNRTKALEDLKFKAGEQWPADIASQRNAAKRPCLTINVLPTFTHQVANDIRQNRPAINVSPLGDDASKESAELMASRIRAIERDSAADIAYDTGIESAIDIGFGYWRILKEWKTPGSFEQVLTILRVRNPFTVLLDDARQQPDGSDAGWAFVSDMIDRDEFKTKWPKANPVSWRERGVGDEYKEWITKDKIRIAEYFTIEHEYRRIVQLENGNTVWWDETSDEIKALVASKQMRLLNDREAECQRVMWYKITALEVLEEEEWDGLWIPIIEVLGDEIDIEGKVTRSGIIRNAKDPMRMKNYWATSKTEKVALAPKPTYIVWEGQTEGYEGEWETAHSDPKAYLTVVPATSDSGQLLPPPILIQAGGVPAGMVEAEKGAESDLVRTTGVAPMGSERLTTRQYDESGKALREVRRTEDIGSFHYSDNFARSLRHTGRVLLDLIPKVEDTERIVPVVGEDGKESMIKIDPTQNVAVRREAPPRPEGMSPEQHKMQEPRKVFNPKKGNYGVTVTTGPSYATRRIEAREELQKMLPTMPEPMRGVVAALIAKYSDSPGSTELYKALVKMLPAGTFAPDPQDLSPAVAALLKSLENAIKSKDVEIKQLLKEVTDRNQEFKIAGDKVANDFQAKIMKIIADANKEQCKMMQQSEERMASAFTAQLGEMTKQVESVLKSPLLAGQQPAPQQFVMKMPRPAMKRVVTKRDKQGRAEEITEMPTDASGEAVVRRGNGKDTQQ